MPADEDDTGRRYTGKVKLWQQEKGIGFIIPDDGGKDMFVHHTMVKVPQGEKASLSQGQEVEYSHEKEGTQRGSCARCCNVTAIGGGFLTGVQATKRQRNGRSRTRSRCSRSRSLRRSPSIRRSRSLRRSRSPRRSRSISRGGGGGARRTDSKSRRSIPRGDRSRSPVRDRSERNGRRRDDESERRGGRAPLDGVDKLRAGDQILALSETNNERECTVRESNESHLLVSYNGFKQKYDEWIAKNSSRILQILAPALPPLKDKDARDRSTSIPRMGKTKASGNARVADSAELDNYRDLARVLEKVSNCHYQLTQIAQHVQDGVAQGRREVNSHALRMLEEPLAQLTNIARDVKS